MRETFKNLTLLIASLAISLLAAEGVLRLLAPQRVPRFPRGLFVSDPALGYRLTPLFRGTASTGEYRTALRTDRLGLREDRDYAAKPANTDRILALGDSFTMGVGVESADAFPKVLERLLAAAAPARSVEVVNAGVPGYNTRQERTYLQASGLALQPDLVLLNVFVGNDIHDNLVEDRVKVVDGLLVDDGDATSGGLLPHGLRVALSRSHLYQLLWPLQRRLRDATYAEAESRRMQAYLAIYARTPDERVDAMWAATWKEIARTRDVVAGHGARMAIVIIPELRQVDPAMWQGLEPVYRRDEPNRRIVEYCTREGIPVLDLLPSFLAAGQPRAHYYRVDNHWTVTGNVVAATATRDFLTSAGLAAHGGASVAASRAGSGR
jgi:hypothetical protein